MMQAKSVIILKANSGILKFGGGIKMLGVKILGWVGYWVVAVISVDAYPFLAFSDLSPWGYRNRSFPVALSCLIVRRPNLEVATQSFPYESNCKCYKKHASGLWPVLFTLNYFFLFHTLSSSAAKLNVVVISVFLTKLGHILLFSYKY